MISAFKPFFSKKPFSCAINTGNETVGNNGTPIRTFSWATPMSGVERLVTRIRNKKVKVLRLFMIPPKWSRGLIQGLILVLYLLWAPAQSQWKLGGAWLVVHV